MLLVVETKQLLPQSVVRFMLQATCSIVTLASVDTTVRIMKIIHLNCACQRALKPKKSTVPRSTITFGSLVKTLMGTRRLLVLVSHVIKSVTVKVAIAHSSSHLRYQQELTCKASQTKVTLFMVLIKITISGFGAVISMVAMSKKIEIPFILTTANASKRVYQ